MVSTKLYREPIYRLECTIPTEKMGNNKNKKNPYRRKTLGGYNKRKSKGTDLINNIKSPDWMDAKGIIFTQLFLGILKLLKMVKNGMLDF